MFLFFIPKGHLLKYLQTDPKVTFTLAEKSFSLQVGLSFMFGS